MMRGLLVLNVFFRLDLDCTFDPVDTTVEAVV
jgi:hypothetical protein